MLVSQGTFDFIRSTAGEVGPPSWIVAVSNRGGVEPGAAHTDAATRQVRSIAAAAGVDARSIRPSNGGSRPPTKTGEGFSSMFTAMGSFGVLAGLLLLVNLFVMLAAERKTELGMARAVGMRRSELVGAFATEGWLYAVVATSLGVLVGIGLGAISSPSRLASSPPSTTASTSTSRSSQAVWRARSQSGSSLHWRPSSARASASAG